MEYNTLKYIKSSNKIKWNTKHLNQVIHVYMSSRNQMEIHLKSK